MQRFLNLLFEKRFLGLLFLAGLTVGYIIFHDESNLPDIQAVREQSDGYALINPLLFYEAPNSFDDYENLANRIQKIISDSSGQMTWPSASVYYRNLKDSRWFGVGELKKYDPASLLKVALMIAYFKHAETDPALLEKEVTFTRQIFDDRSIPFDLGTKLAVNTNYSTSELIERMIVESDNGAMYTLTGLIDKKAVDKVFASLGLESPSQDKNYEISAREYASFFRILYNSTYLSRPMSEKALTLLSRTTFDSGIRAGIDSHIVVAHKYGERILSENNVVTGIELHDCGIIYHPTKPYLLCVMTRGESEEKLKDLIKNISQTVYSEVID